MPRIATDLPDPDRDARQHGERVAGYLRAAIEQAGGSIPFARYMEIALHAPGLGYYSAGSTKFGAEGDFVTAPEISPLFGRCVARQAGSLLEAADASEVLEFGAGTGAMACQVMAELERAGEAPDRYAILEPSGELRERQRARVADCIPSLASRIEWLDSLPESFHGVVLANEVLDAMPVHRVVLTDEGLRELYVAVNDGGFRWTLGPASDARLDPRVATILHETGREHFESGYVFEINLSMEDWVTALARMLHCGAVLIFDYGFSRREFYHPQRREGTLMCHYRHRTHGDPLILAGLQDITAHIDFTALAEAATANGLDVSGYATQANFLLANGLSDMAEAAMASASAAERARLSQALQRLLFPSEMGDLFKVMLLTRGTDIPSPGFALRDERMRL
jgi:SAM-dependent MidA family methyltransferase